MKSSAFARLAVFAALVLGAAGPAFADGEGIYPTVPFRTGSQRIEFGIEGPAARNITIDVEGPPGAGEQDRFIWRQNVVVPRNAAGIHPYLVILPLIRPGRPTSPYAWSFTTAPRRSARTSIPARRCRPSPPRHCRSVAVTPRSSRRLAGPVRAS